MKENFFNEDCKTCFAKKRCASEWTEGCQDYQRYKRKQEILQDICCRIPYKVRTVYNMNKTGVENFDVVMYRQNDFNVNDWETDTEGYVIKTTD
jgi:hypothetical protein